MIALAQAALALVVRYPWVMEIVGAAWAWFQSAKATREVEQKDTEVAKQIDASVAGAGDAALDERLRHYQRD